MVPKNSALVMKKMNPLSNKQNTPFSVEDSMILVKSVTIFIRFEREKVSFIENGFQHDIERKKENSSQYLWCLE